MGKELVAQSESQISTQPEVIGVFSGMQAFENAQRMAQALASSALVPQAYRGKVADCLIALEISQRVKTSPLMVMQNLDVIHGKTSWSSKYIIAAINSCGRFEPLDFELSGSGDDFGCIAFTKNLKGKELRSPRVTIKMAKDEGWYGKNGSKWPTMPELMLQYRAASFFGRLHASDILLGMRSTEEERDIIDITPENISTKSQVPDAASELNKKNSAE